MSARDAANTARLAAAKAKAATDARTIAQNNADDDYAFKKVGNTGKTQAQLDAQQGQIVAEEARVRAAKLTKDAADNKPKWIKASTINTANGPVDVDANGVAADGSVPVAVVADTKASGVPAGFTAGPFPKELEQFFGSSEGIVGYRIETLTDKNGRTYNQLSVATSPTSSKTFGAGFTQSADGKYSLFSPASGDGSGTSTTGTTTLKTAAQLAADEAAAKARGERQSAYDLLYSQFKLYGLESLVEPLKGLITSGASPSEFTIKLRESDSYKKRFSANAQRIAKGLRSLSESEYIQLEDQYQDVMRRYGLPDTYYTRGEMGIQEGFTKFLEGDVSPVELEDRISTAQKRVLNANPEVTQALKQFYPDITNADILAYTLDPKNAIENIKRKVTAAEIGGAAIQSGLQTGMTRAEELGAAGITKAQAQQGFGTIAGGLERGSQLASIYGENPYTQTTAEQEVFGLAGKTEAEKQRKKLTGLEKATFSGQTGLTSGALARDRAGAY
jgi:hypothetical protein